MPLLMLAMLLVFTALVPVVLVRFAQTGEWFYLAWAAAVGWFWFNALRTAYRIDVDGDVVTFRLLGRRRATTFARIRSIKAQGSGYAKLRFDGGRVDLLGAFDNFHDFVARVKRANPAVELKGV